LVSNLVLEKKRPQPSGNSLHWSYILLKRGVIPQQGRLHKVEAELERSQREREQNAMQQERLQREAETLRAKVREGEERSQALDVELRRLQQQRTVSPVAPAGVWLPGSALRW
jgi:septal ring factor EnvC (AmiA/AmiB activator)